ncbi:alcohol dehydrogenase catalytic domain-containing protein [Belnapia moabensis]|uniref:alcohol dehydrogenase catalytic domain-containing protein n=1 Tax=Belnapia moabensis TaxID=365533 RepID=UPI0012EECBB6
MAIAATSVNPVDHRSWRQGCSITPSPPAILGCDVVGTVLALGAEVSGVNLRRSAFRRTGASFERVPTSH